MKAILLDKTGKFHLEQVDRPIPKNNEVQVKIVASGFNPIDYQMIDHEMERKLLHSPILGREFSGVVSALGNTVNDFKIGDEVFCGSGSMGSNGTYAQYITVPEAILAHKPSTISFEQAAAIPSAGLTALQIYTRMSAGKTSPVFITGAAGGVGNMLVKLLLAKGLQNIIATAGNESSMASLLMLGLKKEQIINYKSEDVCATALSLNNGFFATVIDLVGNAMADTSAALLQTNGTYFDVTNFSTALSREILFNKGATVINISNYVYGSEKNYAYYQEGLAQWATMLDAAMVMPPNIEVIGNLTVATVVKAHTMMRENQTRGKKLIMQIST